MDNSRKHDSFRVEESRPIRFSSRQTLFLKFFLAPGLAAIWLIFSTLGFLGKARLNGEVASPLGTTIFLLVGLGAAYIFHRSFGALKNVWLSDEYLLISNGLRTEQIPLRWSIDLSWKFFSRGDQVVYTITFDRNTAFGPSIDFLCNRKRCNSPEMRRLMTVTRWNDRKHKRRQKLE